VSVIYRIREVDGRDDEIADVLSELHRLTFLAVRPFRHLTSAIGGSLIAR
jgi:hypothetical protein